MTLNTGQYLLYISETLLYSPEKEGRPQLKSPPWLERFPAPPDKTTNANVPTISRRIKANTMTKTVDRSIPVTVLDSWGACLAMRSPGNREI